MGSSEHPRWAILMHGSLDRSQAKTGMALLMERPETVVAVIDGDHQGPERTVGEVLGVGRGVPIVRTLDEAIEKGAERLLVGAALPGGRMPERWRSELQEALGRGLSVWNGLHTELAQDPQLAAAAEASGASIVDLRSVPSDLSVPTLAPRPAAVHVVLAVGSDCNVGKMTAMRALTRRARSAGHAVEFVATGQTGVLLEGHGMAIDRVISDFVAGAAERLVDEAVERLPGQKGVVLVEGQGSLVHPFFSGVSLGLLHGTRPDAMVLCHEAGRLEVRHCPGRELPSLPELVDIHQQAAAWVKPSPVVALALSTWRLDDQAALRALEEAHAVTGLVAEDPIRWPGEGLLEAVFEGGTG